VANEKEIRVVEIPVQEVNSYTHNFMNPDENLNPMVQRQGTLVEAPHAVRAMKMVSQWKELVLICTNEKNQFTFWGLSLSSLTSNH